MFVYLTEEFTQDGGPCFSLLLPAFLYKIVVLRHRIQVTHLNHTFHGLSQICPTVMAKFPGHTKAYNQALRRFRRHTSLQEHWCCGAGELVPKAEHPLQPVGLSLPKGTKLFVPSSQAFRELSGGKGEVRLQ